MSSGLGRIEDPFSVCLSKRDCLQSGWAVGADGVVAFGGGDAKPLLLPSKELIQETLSYAKELERIV